ncbi:sodium:solute symporter family transporter [Hydrogenovibrio thermophilus]|uniref:Sodium/proline symporter n=1 Tax=Hydrogenovibrio thermophilus TaxID=265883 RepID=A0A410H3K1_9GAMM|nr:hypothetical protein [Hydrogenovibrio thermophilus]QAB15486.1 hypothetical protein EPV75_07315 [Hydrogenovibrio thermophilus]
MAQSIVMLGGMLMMVYFGVVSLGSFGDINHLLHEVSSDYMFWFPSDLNAFSAILFIIGWVFGGMGVIGQPHVVIRFMTLHPDRTPREMQFYYYGWFTVFYGLTIIVGLLSRLLIPSTDNFDAEMALPLLADQLMPDMFAGLMLAALFAATMSTVDSLILSCSASLTRDLRNTPTNSLMLTKLATFTILVVAVSIALSNNQTVFSLVLDAWGLLGSAFGPLIIWLALKQRINQAWAILTILVGMLSFTLISYFGWLSFVYTITFGFLFGLGTAFLGSRFIPVAANKNPG